MSMLLRPSDPQLASIIDRLVDFVARNGPEFEKMMKIKQQNDDRFNFMNEGEPYNDYYQSRLLELRRRMIGMF